jgi:hypothetical protein
LASAGRWLQPPVACSPRDADGFTVNAVASIPTSPPTRLARQKINTGTNMTATAGNITLHASRYVTGDVTVAKNVRFARCGRRGAILIGRQYVA